MTDRQPIDWERIEAEYRAGQLSLREIARAHGITDTAIRKKAKALSWERSLADKVREAAREKLVRSDGSQAGSHPQRARTDREIVEAASLRGLEVVTSHRADIHQLHGLKRVLAGRLSDVLHGGSPEGPCLGERESPGDLLEKLSRVTARLIPLERQAFNLDAGEPEKPPAETGAGNIEDLKAKLAELGLPTRIFET